jgi:hypothetical protein
MWVKFSVENNNEVPLNRPEFSANRKWISYLSYWHKYSFVRISYSYLLWWLNNSKEHLHGRLLTNCEYRQNRGSESITSFGGEPKWNSVCSSTFIVRFGYNRCNRPRKQWRSPIRLCIPTHSSKTNYLYSRDYLWGRKCIQSVLWNCMMYWK